VLIVNGCEIGLECAANGRLATMHSAAREGHACFVMDKWTDLAPSLRLESCLVTENEIVRRHDMLIGCG
jgi:hypothetical protein